MVFVVIEPENLPHNHATKKSKKTISKKKKGGQGLEEKANSNTEVS